MGIKEFSTWIGIFILFTSSILIFNIWYVFFNCAFSKKDERSSLVFISLALCVWGISDLATNYIINDPSLIEIIQNTFSAVANICFLMGATCSESIRRLFKNKSVDFISSFTFFSIIGIIMILSTLIIKNYTLTYN